ncbi:hypothetical protein D1872_218410 [compost metagenome]
MDPFGLERIKSTYVAANPTYVASNPTYVAYNPVYKTQAPPLSVFRELWRAGGENKEYRPPSRKEFLDEATFLLQLIGGPKGGGAKGAGKTIHGEIRANQRGFSNDKINDIKNNYSHKVYQSGGRTVYAKKNGNYYDVVVINRNGEVITTVGGNTKSLKTWKDVTKMLNNQGGFSSLPVD